MYQRATITHTTIYHHTLSRSSRLIHSIVRFPPSIVPHPRIFPIRPMSTPTTPPSPPSGPTHTKAEIYKNKARVYTKTGDKGTTSLFNMERRSKADDYFSALGDTDELNANLGVVRSHCVLPETEISDQRHDKELIETLHQLDEQLSEIQSRLFDVGAHLATPQQSSNEAQRHRTKFAEHHVDQLEEWIDAMESVLPPLKNFILPSGGIVSSHLHVCRSVCRRAERSTVPLVERGDSEPVVQRYLNRLSDYLFVAARYAAKASGQTETIWKKPREPRVKKDDAPSSSSGQ